MYFAVFAVADADGGIAATTRAADRGEAGRIGLPGGKVDPGETAEQAVRRESAEEGWLMHGQPILIHAADVEGRPVAWFSFPSATMLTEFKEYGRICPVIASRQAVAASGYGNEFLGD